MHSRFIMEDATGFVQGTRVVVDTVTGVQYLLAYWGSNSGLTILVDETGKPLLHPHYGNNRTQ